MGENKASKPTEVEYRQLRRDAQHNVADAHKALQGDSAALAEWRRQQPGASDK